VSDARWWQERAHELLVGAELTPQERAFCQSMTTWPLVPTPRQQAWLGCLVERACFEWFTTALEGARWDEAEACLEWIFAYRGLTPRKETA
jgi:hypothetical protein